MEYEEITPIFIIASVIVFLLVFTVIVLFTVFLKRKNTLIKNKEDTERRYKQEIANTQIEIREQTLRNISWELHDNIGQLITLAKIQMQNAKGDEQKTEEATHTIAKALTELRALSKSINPNTIKNLELIEALQFELQRFNRLNFLETTFHLEGKQQPLPSNVTIILFRILQEFFSNTIKHSRATHLTVTMKFLEKTLIIEAFDNGEGFEKDTIKHGQGLANMENRAKLIGADFMYNTKKHEGTTLKIEYPIINRIKNEHI